MFLFIIKVIMLIISVEEKVTHSAKNGKDYYSYKFVGGEESEVNGVKVLTKRNINLQNSTSVQEYVAKGKIKSYKDLEGKYAIFCRKCPVYLSEYEKKYNVVNADLMILQS